MIKGNLFQKMHKYTSWLKEYKIWLTTNDSRAPTNPELELICTAADTTAADCLAEDESDSGAQKLYSLIPEVRQLMSERE